MARIKAVLWDMDGTLVDSEAIAVEALADALAAEGTPAPERLYEGVVGRSPDSIYDWLRQQCGLRLDFAAWEKQKHCHYLRRSAGLTGFADALETWRRLDAAGIAQAVVSNSDREVMDINLRAVGLTRPGLISVSRNDVRRGKPDPEGYLRAAWLLGAARRDCVIVEDSLSGAAAGLASGIRTLFAPHATVPPPEGVEPLAAMAELEALAAPLKDSTRFERSTPLGRSRTRAPRPLPDARD